MLPRILVLLTMSAPAWAVENPLSGHRDGTLMMPPQASTVAASVDDTYYFIYWVCWAFLIILMGAMGYFVVRYKMTKEGQLTSSTKGSHALELVWATGPTVLLVAMFVMGFKAWMDMNVPPADSMEVRVKGQKWSWAYEYPAYGIETTELKVPKGQPVRFVMSSTDVLHSFFIPAFRIKKDVVPGRYTVVWAEPIQYGTFPVYCTEYCGTDHSRMRSEIEVMEASAFKEWVAENKPPEGGLVGAALGEKLYKVKGCVACHSVDGSASVGPTLKGLWGKEEPLEGGGSVLVEENYVRESLMAPAAKIVAGYPPSMPTFQGQLDDAEVDGLIEFIKSVQ